MLAIHCLGTVGLVSSDIPTAVNFERTCMIIIVVIMSAKMCVKSEAPWKMMVFATSTVREKHCAWMPVLVPSADGGPMSVHSGRAVFWHIE